MTNRADLEQLLEMALASKPYLRATLERKRAQIVTLESEPARRAFEEYLRRILIADHSDAIHLIDERPEGP